MRKKLLKSKHFSLFFYGLMIISLIELTGCSAPDKKPLKLTDVTPKSVIKKEESSITIASQKVVNEALQLQGEPYRWGGESPSEGGFDCSGLVYYVFHKLGIHVPRTAMMQAQALPKVDMEHRKPGDLVFFTTEDKPFNHVGIYVGDDRFVHAPSRTTGHVMVSDLRQPYWWDRFIGVRRPLSENALNTVDHGFSGEMCAFG